jgi:hypothetical protein
VSPVKYELGFSIPEDCILHSHCRENLKSYIVFMNSFSVALFLTDKQSSAIHVLDLQISDFLQNADCTLKQRRVCTCV